MRKLTHAELIARQQQQQARLPRLPFTVVLNNIRSLHNVGSIFLIELPLNKHNFKSPLEFFGAVGDLKLEKESSITCDGVGVAKLWLCGITGYQIILLEQTTESIPYDGFEPGAPVCLVVGNEIEGVARPLVALCDAAVEIAMAGLKNSLNVSVAFGIVAYHIRSRLPAGRQA